MIVREFSRAQRVAQEIQKEISKILQHKVKDPRISMATIASVELSRDLGYGKVFVTFLNISYAEHQYQRSQDGIKALNKAASFIRFLLGKTMHLRVIPQLTFFYDTSLVDGMRMSNLVSTVIINDKIRRANTEDKEKNNEISS